MVDVQLRLLGPVEVVDVSGGVVAMGGPKERAVLALLGIHANEAVSEDRLADALWGDAPPRTATKTVHTYVSRLRRALAAAGPGDDSLVIETRPPGYRLRVAPGALDVVEAEELIAQAQVAAADGDHSWAAVALGRAWRGWRGKSLGEFADMPFASATAIRLEELRHVALEGRLEAELACGRHAPLVGELEALCAAYPMRERLWAQRMVALYRSGRQAEALRVYQDLRRHLGDELGLAPGPDLANLERMIVAQDPLLTWDAAAPGVETNRPVGGLPSGVVSFLLTDIESSAELWDEHPTAMVLALERHDGLVLETVAAGGGTVIKSKGEGDATLSVFRRASDAIATALDLQTAMAGEAWSEGIELRVRVAVHTGEAHERDGDYYGPTINRAARLRSLARGGQTVVSEVSAALVRDHLRDGAALTDLGRHELRGLARDEQVFELATRAIERSPEPDASLPSLVIALPSELVLTRGSVSLVGRDSEVERLGALRDEAAHGVGRFAFISGEPGIGKTRLAAEVARSAYDQGAIVLFGRCDEDLGVPYQPFAEALAHFVAHCPPHRLAGSLGRLGGELVRLEPRLTELVPGITQPLRTDPETERQRLFDAVTAWLAAVAAETPVVVVLDDLHWATKPTLMLLRHLLRAPDTGAVLVLGTYRDTELDRAHPLADMLADLRRDATVDRVALKGLDESGARSFVEASAGRALDDTERQMARAVGDETNGNPFFMSEMMRHLVETGAIYRADGRWATSFQTVQEAGLPQGVREVISRRISRLSDAANKALAVAAVVGQSFEHRLLGRVADAADDPDTLLDALDEAVRAGVLVESGRGYGFAHALVRHTLYAELTTARRTRLHRRVGEAIEALPDADSHLEALAHHFAEAALDGQETKAAGYALAAGQRAVQHLAQEEAVGHLERGLGVLDLADDPDPTQRADLLYALATARWSLGERPAARQAALAAADLARLLGDGERLARAAILLAALAEFGVPDQAAAVACEDALEVLTEADVALRARTTAALARYRGFCEADGAAGAVLAERALQLARQAEDPALLVAALNARLLSPALPAERDILADELMTVAVSLGDARSLADGLLERSITRLSRGDMVGFDADIAALGDLGATQQWWWPLATAAVAKAGRASMDGRFTDAEAHSNQASAYAPSDLDVTTTLFAESFARLISLGDFDGLLAGADLILAQIPSLAPEYAGVRAMVYAHHGQLTEAAPLLAQLTEGGIVRLPLSLVRRWGVAGLAEVCALVADKHAALTLYDALLEQRGTMVLAAHVPLSFGAADRYLGMVAVTLGRWDDAEAHYRAALELEGRVGSPVFLAQTRLWYGRMLLARAGLDDRERGVGLVTEALATAEQFGMAWVAAEARRLLASPAMTEAH